MNESSDGPGDDASEPFSPVERPVRLAQKAYDEIRFALLSGGDITDGRFSEDDLAKALSVSRTPVRDALHRLAMVGLIEAAHPGGYSRRRTTIRGVNEHCELRLLLEPRAAARAAVLDADVRAELIAGLRANLKPENPVEEAEFHRAIAAASNDGSLPSLIGDLSDLAGLDEVWLEGSSTGNGLPRPDHDEIVSALEQGDPEAAERAMSRHIESVRRRLTELLAQLPAKVGA
ncbi:MAG: GntR family transcriptional regulator [Thermoleophilia bacterium]|nr:GntR family transcriptional regulator [Thermoleophilia bacterium]